MLKLSGGGRPEGRPEVPAFVRKSPVTAEVAGLVPLVVAGMTKLSSHSRSRVGRLHAGDAAFCQRQAALKATQSGEWVQPAAMTAYTALGNTVERLVMEALYARKVLLFTQYRLPDIPFLNLGGYVDGVIVLAGKLRVLEVKSCGDLPTTPRGEHWAQAMIYSAVTGLPATLLYFSRNVAKFGGELLLREFPLDEDLTANWRLVTWRAAYAAVAIRLGVLPDIPSHLRKETDCGWCDFRSLCWRGEPREVELSSLTPEVHAACVAEATKFTEEFLAPEIVANRRVGILHHLEKHGNEYARQLLVGEDWAGLVGD